MRVLVCGDRNWSNKDLIEKELKILPSDTVVIQGECKGADIIGKQIAKKLGYRVLSFPAEWEKYGRSAGPIRNKQMIVEGQPEFVLAFHNNINNSRGTKDMIRKAKQYGISYKIITE